MQASPAISRHQLGTHLRQLRNARSLRLEEPEGNPDMYEEVTAERAINEACMHLLTTIGMNAL